jgi:hypothetical protein
MKTTFWLFACAPDVKSQRACLSWLSRGQLRSPTSPRSRRPPPRRQLLVDLPMPVKQIPIVAGGFCLVGLLAIRPAVAGTALRRGYPARR